MLKTFTVKEFKGTYATSKQINSIKYRNIDWSMYEKLNYSKAPPNIQEIIEICLEKRWKTMSYLIQALKQTIYRKATIKTYSQPQPILIKISQKIIAKYKHNDRVYSIAWSPDDRYIVTSGRGVFVYD